MSGDDEFDELEIEIIAAIISLERSEKHRDFEGFKGEGDCRDDLFQEHQRHSGGCLILIAGMVGIIGIIALGMIHT